MNDVEFTKDVDGIPIKKIVNKMLINFCRANDKNQCTERIIAFFTPTQRHRT